MLLLSNSQGLDYHVRQSVTTFELDSYGERRRRRDVHHVERFLADDLLRNIVRKEAPESEWIDSDAGPSAACDATFDAYIEADKIWRKTDEAKLDRHTDRHEIMQRLWFADPAPYTPQPPVPATDPAPRPTMLGRLNTSVSRATRYCVALSCIF